MIKDIEERLHNLSKRGNEGFDAKEDFRANAEADIEHLLSLVKKQREALAKIAHRAASYTDRESPKIVLNDVREMAARVINEFLP